MLAIGEVWMISFLVVIYVVVYCEYEFRLKLLNKRCGAREEHSY